MQQRIDIPHRNYAARFYIEIMTIKDQLLLYI